MQQTRHEPTIPTLCRAAAINLATLTLMLLAAGCGDGSPQAGLSPVDGMPAFAIVSTEFGQATTISLLDRGMEPLANNWLTTATVFQDQIAALSTDAVLPTTQAGDGSLAVIDRFGFDVVSRFDWATGEVFGQVRTDNDNREIGAEPFAFASNPQDVLFVDATSAWVSRNNPNDAPDAASPELGNDLIEIDPSTMTRTGRRVDLATLNTVVDGETIYARPARMVRRGSFVVVGLARLSGAFDVAGDGAIGLVDLADLSVRQLSLAPLTNCGSVRPIPGSDNVLVSCDGDPDFVTFVNPPSTVGHAVVRVDPQTGAANLVEQWVQGTVPNTPAIVRNPVAVGPNQIVAAAPSSDASQMIYFALNLTTREHRELLRAQPQFGASAFDEVSQTVLLPGGTRGVLRVDLSVDPPVQHTSLAAPSDGLPVAAIYSLTEM